jgi:hypothetical protein
MKSCPRCKTPNPLNSNFCNRCGSVFVIPQTVRTESQNSHAKRFGRWFARRNPLVKGFIIASVACVFLMGSLLLSEPPASRQTVQTPTQPLDPDTKIIGIKPHQSSLNGEVLAVTRYLRENLNDYDSSEFVEWSPVTKVDIDNQKYWGVRLKLRAKNAFGAYILRDTYYFIRNDKVIFSRGLNGE